jgi:hypothetical protein
MPPRESPKEYVTVVKTAWSIPHRQDALFRLIYEVTPWREHAKRWFLVSMEELSSNLPVMR